MDEKPIRTADLAHVVLGSSALLRRAPDGAIGASRNRDGQRLQGMTSSMEATAARPKILSTQQLEMVQRVWQLAGWPPVSGYGIVVLAATLAANDPLAATLTSVDFDDASSVANAVRALHDSRAHMWK
jgi:hypothetical protein